MKWQVASGKWQVKTGFLLRLALWILAIAVGLSSSAPAQDTPAPKDDALDSLLEKLSDPSDRDRTDKPAPSKKDDPAGKKAGSDSKAKDSGGTGAAKSSGAKDDKSKGSKPGGSPSLTGKDQEVDELLQKLGETTDTPSPDDRPRGGAGGEKTDGQKPSQKPDQADRSRLSGKDKETDEHLEELTGRKRRKKNDNEE